MNALIYLYDYTVILIFIFLFPARHIFPVDLGQEVRFVHLKIDVRTSLLEEFQKQIGDVVGAHFFLVESGYGQLLQRCYFRQRNQAVLRDSTVAVQLQAFQPLRPIEQTRQLITTKVVHLEVERQIELFQMLERREVEQALVVNVQIWSKRGSIRLSRRRPD